MKTARRCPSFSSVLNLLGILAAVCWTGCDNSSQKRIQQGNDLKLVGLAYHEFIDINETGPTGWSDLKGKGMSDIRNRLEAAGYAVVWGMTRDTAAKGLSNSVIAYPSDGTKKGGKILFFDGSVRETTANELTEALSP